MKNYYQGPSEVVEETRDGFYIIEPRVHLHIDEDR